MTTMTKKELISATKKRYLKADKKDKGKMLDEFCGNIGYNRSYAIRILQAGYDTNRVADRGRKPRKDKYDSRTMAAAEKIWELLDFPCGQRLQPMLEPMTNCLAAHGEMKVSANILNQLKTISAKTLDRKLKPERERLKLKRNRGATRHGSLLKSSVPIRITNWDTRQVGFMEMDTVAHNGGDPSGECIYSLDMVEIYSGWAEQYAVMGKGERGVAQAINSVKAGLPFVLTGLDSDSGGEFINWHLVRYCAKNKLLFTRSRPDRKNDNAYVEQKNYTHIRRALGYGRYDNQKQLDAMNDLYRNELRLFNNFFRPVMKIVSKEKINNSVCRKKYDTAKTPYQRLVESQQMSREQKRKLTEMYLVLNPVKLKNTIDRKIQKIRATKATNEPNANLQIKCPNRRE
jgi:hypothetical protein